MPPIPKPVTTYSTISSISSINKAAAHAVHQYCDESCHIIWNNSAISGGILIRLGNIYVMKMQFSIIGGYPEESGFEQIVFQTKACTSGSIDEN